MAKCKGWRSLLDKIHLLRTNTLKGSLIIYLFGTLPALSADHLKHKTWSDSDLEKCFIALNFGVNLKEEVSDLPDKAIYFSGKVKSDANLGNNVLVESDGSLSPIDQGVVFFGYLSKGNSNSSFVDQSLLFNGKMTSGQEVIHIKTQRSLGRSCWLRKDKERVKELVGRIALASKKNIVECKIDNLNDLNTLLDLKKNPSEKISLNQYLQMLTIEKSLNKDREKQKCLTFSPWNYLVAKNLFPANGELKGLLEMNDLRPFIDSQELKTFLLKESFCTSSLKIPEFLEYESLMKKRVLTESEQEAILVIEEHALFRHWFTIKADVCSNIGMSEALRSYYLRAEKYFGGEYIVWSKYSNSKIPGLSFPLLKRRILEAYNVTIFDPEIEKKEWECEGDCLSFMTPEEYMEGAKKECKKSNDPRVGQLFLDNFESHINFESVARYKPWVKKLENLVKECLGKIH